MNAISISIKNSRPASILLLAALAAVGLAFVWGGAGRMIRMQTQAASKAEFAKVKADEQTKIVIEVAEASGGRIRGKLLEKRGRDTLFAHGESGGRDLGKRNGDRDGKS